MCLAIPAKIIEIRDNDMALVDVGGNIREISIQLTPQAEVGDYVLLHAGYALERLDAAEARGTLRLLEEAYAATPGPV